MDIKLFDSELKVMCVLWNEGDTTAKHISDVLKKEIGWNMNTDIQIHMQNTTPCEVQEIQLCAEQYFFQYQQGSTIIQK